MGLLKKIEDSKENQSKNFEDSLLNINKILYCYEPFDLALLYLKPKKSLEEKLKLLLDKYKMKYRLINKDKFIIQNKNEDVSISLKLDRLKEINENEGKSLVLLN